MKDNTVIEATNQGTTRKRAARDIVVPEWGVRVWLGNAE